MHRACNALQVLALAFADNHLFRRTRRLAPHLHFDNGCHGASGAEEVGHAPSQAQAVVLSVFQNVLPFNRTNEPITLFLTGVGLLSLAQLGRPRSR